MTAAEIHKVSIETNHFSTKKLLPNPNFVYDRAYNLHLIMAEQALYDNSNEPPFPFDAVRSQLSWLPAYLDDHITCPPYDMEPFVNAVLVFGRARTATLQGRYWWPELHELTRRLNSALQLVGAQHHKLELVLRGHSFFVTCSRSPRFDWKVELTHRDVGRNLDYFAPGHLSPTEPKCFIEFVEVETMQIVMAEAVLSDVLKDDVVRNEFQRFNKKREILFNSTMEGLGLRYRFKCIVTSPSNLASVSHVLSGDVPPSASWWEENCVNLYGRDSTRRVLDSRFAFCGFNTKYVCYWPLIRLMFVFLSKYGKEEYWFTSEETGVAFWRSVENVCHRVKCKCDQDGCVNDIDDFINEIKKELGNLANQADKPEKTPYKGELLPYTPPRFKRESSRWLISLNKIKFNVYEIKQLVKISIFERYKLHNRLVRPVLDGPITGDMLAFRRSHQQ